MTPETATASRNGTADVHTPTRAADPAATPLRFLRAEPARAGGRDVLLETWQPGDAEPVTLVRVGDRYVGPGGLVGAPAAASAARDPRAARQCAALAAAADRPAGEPLAWPALFHTGGGDVFDTVAWERRTAEIRDAGGRVVYRQEGVEFPANWSQNAVNIVASKYFYGDLDCGTDPAAGGRETSVRQLLHRVCRTLAFWGARDGYFATPADATRLGDDLVWLCLHQYASFNSPVWFNVGLHEVYGLNGGAENFRWDPEAGTAVACADSYLHPQCSACFIQPVEDSIEGIFALAASEARLFKHGSGTGTDLSTLRSSFEKVKGGGKASGPVSFMRVYDAGASVVKSGGKCLAPHQPVFTGLGVRTAKALAETGEDFTVLSWSRRLNRFAAKTARAWRSGTKPVVAVQTDKGEFHVSSDHPFMLRTGEPARAADLKPGMSLMACTTSPHKGGYVQLRLRPGRGAPTELVHRLVAADVLGWDIADKIVHHGAAGKLVNEPENLTLLAGQGEHAAIHNRERVAAGTHIFQNRVFPRKGGNNGMHASSDFWRDDVRAEAYRAKQGMTLRESGRASAMQAEARRARMLNTGYALINAGHDITTFEGYVRARKAVGRRCPDVPGQLRKFEREFGSYQGFYAELRGGNHRVESVTFLQAMDVYSVEVDDPEPDDKRPWSEHNYVLAPVGVDAPYIKGCVSFNTRRAAKMQTLKDWHPDILKFTTCKRDEDRKARALLTAGAAKSGLTGADDEAYSSVAFQNANLSVRLSDAFLRAAETPGARWHTRPVVPDPCCVTPEHDAAGLLDTMCDCTHECGDPGFQFEDTIQSWHTTPNAGPICSSNPCAEYMHIDNSACNLASLNVLAFRRGSGRFDAAGFRAAAHAFITAQEVLVDRASYPTAAIAAGAHRFRQLGLGFANMGALVMSEGFPYDSGPARSLAGSVSALLQGQAYLTSSALARALGPFPGYEADAGPMNAVVARHAAAARAAASDPSPGAADALWPESVRVLEAAAAAGPAVGYRNSQVSVIAPTGTIAFMMDCDTTGVEPDIALVQYKSLAGGGLVKIVNRCVPEALRSLRAADGARYSEAQIGAVCDYIEAHDTVEGCPDLRPGDLPVFDCAFTPPAGTRSIAPEGHVRMMAAVQPFVSGAISKTVNMPPGAPAADIRAIVLLSWRLGLKAIAVYRDGSKGAQPVRTSAGDPPGPSAAAPAPAPARVRLPMTRPSRTHKFSVQGHEGYLTVGFYPDGRPGELFITMAKEGSTVGGLMDALGTALSIGLQYGVPLAAFAEKFRGSRFEPMGFTQNGDIPLVSSVADYIARWLAREFLPAGDEAPAFGTSLLREAYPALASSYPDAGGPAPAPGPVSRPTDAPPCPNCGHLTVRTGNCHRCFNCGSSLGCS